MIRWFLFLSTLLLSLPVSAHNSLTALGQDIVSDYRFYYTHKPQDQAWIIGGTAALMANTGVDRAIRREWQNGLHGHFWDDVTDLGNRVGGAPQVGFFIPFYLGTYWFGAQFSDNPLGNTASQWSNRALRATFLMAPQQLLFTHLTGGARPENRDSHWRPFSSDRGVSGHAAYGAVPFLSAASLTENPFFKTLWISGSLLPSVARIHADKHYASQALLGWGLSWLSMSAVTRTPNTPHWSAYIDQDRFLIGMRFRW